MILRARPGYCFISADTPEERVGKFGMLLAPSAVWDPGTYNTPNRKPRSMYSIPRTGLVVYHHVTAGWVAQGEGDLTNKRVVFDRWAGKPFKLKWTDGREYEFLNISQWAIFAVLDEDKQEVENESHGV